jgi:hypothetical protein
MDDCARLDTACSKVGRIMSVNGVAPRVAAAPAEPKTIEQLQEQRSDLVEQYLGARPTGSRGWSIAAGVGVGTIAASVGIGAVLLANRGHNSMYQGFNLMFGMPMALAAGGGIGYLVGSRAGETATRPTGEAAAAQVSATRADLERQIQDIDTQLHEADGRRPQPLPAIDDSSKLSVARMAGHAGAGLGLGLLATVGTMAGAEKLIGGQIAGGPAFAASLAAPAVAAGAISYLDQRDEAAGRQGSMWRAAGIGAAVTGLASLNPGLAPIPMPLRVAGGAVIGAAVGTAVHLVSASSRD